MSARKIAVDPKVVDRQLAEIWRNEQQIERQLVPTMESFHRAIGDSRKYQNVRNSPWTLSDEQAETKAREMVAAGTISMTYRQSTEHSLGKLDELRVSLAQLRKTAKPLEAQFAKHRWSRFFMVEGGHIHSSMSCHSCTWTTRFGWLPELSGETEAQAVVAHGALLCTFCYPSAPVEWTNGRELEAQAKKASNCPGSKTMDYPRETARLGYYSGNYGICSHCGERVTVTPTRMLRTHKKGSAK
jgi:hypothetical protein